LLNLHDLSALIKYRPREKKSVPSQLVYFLFILSQLVKEKNQQTWKSIINNEPTLTEPQLADPTSAAPR
jgi:hypothetical protein